MTSATPESKSDRTHSRDKRVLLVAYRKVQKEFKSWLETLPNEVVSDLQELFRLHAAADTPAEKTEISDTINELLMPQSLVIKLEKQFNLEDEDAKVRQRLENYRRNVGNQIKKRRKELGMSQDVLAELASIPQSHVCRLEKGKHVPTHLTIERIANALGVSPSQLDPGFDSELVD